MTQVRSRETAGDPSIDESGRGAVKWMVAMTSGDMTERQLRDFDRWRDADARNAEAWERMAGGLRPFDTLARSGLPHGSLSRMPPVVRPNRRAVLAGLAGLAVAGGAGTFAAQRFVPLEDLLSDHYTKTAEHGRHRLDDDSTILLGPRSSVNVAMTPETRGLEFVRGKMMLDIAANDPRPVSVDLGRVRFAAPTGSFILSRQDDHVAVSGLRGRGTLAGDGGQRLSIGERERVVFSGPNVVRSAIDIEVASSWESGFAVVRDEAVADIVDEIRPYYAGFIQLSREAGTRHATGVFNLFDPVASLSALAQSVGLEMTHTAGCLIRIGNARV